MATVSLSEPQVLAHTKRTLFDDATEGSYAVVDTQFARDEWRVGEPIEPAIHEILAPFNHVIVGGGYPDLVGVRQLDAGFVAVERVGEEPQLIAIEAKGYDQHGRVDTERGIVQAYDRLHEANVVFLAAPVEAISQTDRTLARELNVGVLAVDATGAVEPLETPRVVGARSTDSAHAIRFQASAQGVADASFGLNHPKNYLGYPLALYADEPTEQVLSAYRVVGATDAARRGAAFLDLIDRHPRRDRLTPLGEEVVRFAQRRYGSVEAALSEFDAWYRSPTRFVEAAPAWGQLARQIVFQYPATQLLVETLQNLHEDQQPAPTLNEFVTALYTLQPSFTIELFVRGDEATRRRVLTPDGELRYEELVDGHIYHSPTVFQLKTMLYHVGLLTERGREPTRLDPTGDVWALREPV